MIKRVLPFYLLACSIFCGGIAWKLAHGPTVPKSQVGLMLQIGEAHHAFPPGIFSVVIVSRTGVLALGMYGGIVGDVDVVREGLMDEPSSTEKSVAVGMLDIIEMQQRRPK